MTKTRRRQRTGGLIIRRIAAVGMACLLLVSLMNVIVLADPEHGLTPKMISYSVTIAEKQEDYSMKSGQEFVIGTNVNASNVEGGIEPIAITLSLTHKDASGNNRPDTDGLEFRTLGDIYPGKVTIEKLSAGNANPAVYKITFRNMDAGSSTMDVPLFAKFKNGITANGDYLSIATEAVTYKNIPVENDIIERSPVLKATAEAQYFAYTVGNTTPKSSLTVTGTTVPTVTFTQKIENTTKETDLGLIHTGEVRLTNVVQLPANTTFEADSVVKVGGVVVKNGNTVTIGGEVWTFANVGITGSNKLTYDLVMTNTDAPYNLTETSFTLTMEKLKNTTADGDWPSTTHKITSTATVNSKDWFGGAQAPAEKEAVVTLTKTIGGGETGETGKESQSVSKTFDYQTQNGGTTTDPSNEVQYNTNGTTDIVYRYGDIKNKQEGAITDVTLTEEAKKSTSATVGGYDPVWLIPQKVFPGVFYDKDNARIGVNYQILVGGTVKATGTTSTTGANAAIALTEATGKTIKIVYDSLPVGAYVSTAKAEQPGMMFRVIEPEDSRNVLSESSTNRVVLSYTYKSANRSASATASFTYHAKARAIIGTGKGYQNHADRAGNFGGDYIEYTLAIQNKGSVAMTNVSIIDKIDGLYIDEVGADGKRPVALYMRKDTSTTPFNTKFFSIAAGGSYSLSEGSTWSGRRLLAAPGYAELAVTTADGKTVMTLNNSVLKSLTQKGKTVESVEVVDSAGNITIPAGYTLFVKYLVRVDPTAAPGSHINNTFTVTYDEGTGGSGGSGGGSGNAELIIDEKTPYVYVNKYFQGTDRGSLSETVKRSDIIGTDTALTYVIESEFYKMHGGTYADEVKKMFVADVLPEQLLMGAGRPDYTLNYTFDYKVTLQTKDAGGNVTGYTTLNKNEYTLVCTPYDNNGPLTGGDTASKTTRLFFELTKNEGAIPEGLRLEITLSFHGLTDANFAADKNPVIENHVYASLAKGPALTDLYGKILYNLTDTTGQSHEEKAWGTKPAVRADYTLNYTGAEEEKLGITKEVVGVNGATDGSNRMELPSLGDTVTFEVTITNQGLPLGGKGAKSLISDLLPPGLEYTGKIMVYKDGVKQADASFSHVNNVEVDGKNRQRVYFEYAIDGNSTYRFVYTAKVRSDAGASLLQTGVRVTEYLNDVVLDAPKSSHKGLIEDMGVRVTSKDDALAEHLAGKVSNTSKSVEDFYAEYDHFYASAPVEYIAQSIRPGIEKAMTTTTENGYLYAIQEVNWKLTVSNQTESPMTGYVICDVLPAGFRLLPKAEQVNADYFEPDYEIADFNDRGDTLLVWHVDDAEKYGAAAVTLQNNETFSIHYTTIADDPDPRSYLNYAYLVPNEDFIRIIIDSDSTRGTLVGDIAGEQQFRGADWESLEAVFNEGRKAVRAEAEVKFYIQGEVTSYKTITNAAGQTAGSLYSVKAGWDEKVTYELTLANPSLGSATPITKLSFLDVLPMPGDMSVKTEQERHSQFVVKDISDVQVFSVIGGKRTALRPGTDFTVYLSTAGQAANAQFDPASAAASWQKTTALAGSNAVLIVLSESYQLGSSDGLVASFKAQVPARGVNKGDIAWNSFAYQFTRGDKTVENEPPKVGVELDVRENDTVSVSGTKFWDDGGDRDGIRPDDLKLTLYANDEEVEGAVYTWNKDNANNWVYTFKDLNKYALGVEIAYRVEEEAVDGYTPADVAGATNFKNSHTPAKTGISVKKDWNDDNNRDGIRPTEIWVQLMADETAEGSAVKLTGPGWTYTWNDLFKYDQGEEIEYSVVEVEVPGGYSEAYKDGETAGSLVVENSHTPEKTSRTVQKSWNDDNNRDGIRPTEIWVQLMAGTEKEGPAVKLTGPGWTYTWNDLFKYDQGEEIEYSVVEVEVTDGYAVGYSEDTFTITNSHTPEKTSRTVQKSWNDDNNRDGIRPTEIWVQLMAGTEKEGPAVKLTGPGWTYTWNDLFKYDQGEEIEYSVVEVEVTDGYAVGYSEDTFTITNSHTPEKTSRTVQKSWNDDNNRDGIRPTEILVQLKAGGNDVGDPVKLEAPGWSYTWDDLLKYENGVEIAYTVEEVAVPDGYSAGYSADTFTITNSHTPGTVSRTVQKAWDDDNDRDRIRPAGIRVQLKADGENVGDPVELTAPGWSYTWNNLKAKNGGVEIKYTVEELNVPTGYAVGYSADGFTVTNTHEPETVRRTVQKLWADDGDADGIRPTEIWVQLKADGANAGEAVRLTGPTWRYAWTSLPKFAAGKEILYTVEETEVPAGYTVRYSTDTFTITNTHDVEEEGGIVLYVNKVLTDFDGVPFKDGRIFTALLVDSQLNTVAELKLPANGDPVAVRGLKSGEIYRIAELQGDSYEFVGFNISGGDLIDKEVLSFRITLSGDNVVGRAYITLNNEADESIEDEDPPFNKPPKWPDPDDDDVIDIPPEEVPLDRPNTGVSGIGFLALPVILASAAAVFMFRGRKRGAHAR